MVDQHTTLESIVDGLAPAKRLKDADKAQKLAQRLVENGSSRSWKNAQIKGMIDGNPPFDPARLKAAAQSWRCNVNFMEGESSISAALTPFYDLFSGAKYFAQVEAAYSKNPAEDLAISLVLTEEFDYWLKEWYGFDFNMQAMLFDMITFGKGFLVWLDKTSWKFQWIAQHLVYVPDQTTADCEKLAVVVVRQTYQTHELWRMIKGRKARDAGWNVEAVKQAIEQATPKDSAGGDSSTADYERIQQQIKDNDLFEGNEAETVQVYHLFVAEFSGKVSHLIVNEKALEKSKGPDKGEAQPVEFLFEARNKFDNFNELIATFFFETLDGSWNGANGLGKKLYSSIEIKNRLNCNIVDGALLRGAITLQAKDANALQKLNLVQIGAFNIIPPDFEVQQSTIMGDLQGPMSVDKMLDFKISSNTGIYRPKLDKPEGNPRTAKEVEMNFQASATLSNSAVNRFYLNLDKFYPVLFKRVAQDKDFQKRCTDRGVPLAALKKVKCVKAYRAVGNGSPFMRQQAMQNIGPLVPMLPEAGRTAWLQETIASQTNAQTARRLVPDPMDNMQQTDHAAWANLENAGMKVGLAPVWTPTQNNSIHAQVHLTAGAAALESLAQGGNPIEVMTFVDQIGMHTHIHIEQLKNDPVRKADYEMLGAKWKKLSDTANKLRAKIKQEAKASAERNGRAQQASLMQQGADPETEINRMKAASDIQLKQVKAAQSLKQKSESHAQKMASADAKLASNIAAQKVKLELQKKAAAEKAAQAKTKPKEDK